MNPPGLPAGQTFMLSKENPRRHAAGADFSRFKGSSFSF
jgi:hypothetical protein